jgi:hypothetical protein
MPNFNPFNAPNNALYGMAVNAYSNFGSGAPAYSNATGTGKHFASNAANSVNLGLLGGTVISSIRLENPPGSGTSLRIASIGGTITVSLSLLSSFSGQVLLNSGGTLGSSASAAAPSMLLNSVVISAASVTSSITDITGGATFMSFPVFPTPFRFLYNGDIVVPAGQSFTASVQGSLSLLGLLATQINITWWEI